MIPEEPPTRAELAEPELDPEGEYCPYCKDEVCNGVTTVCDEAAMAAQEHWDDLAYMHMRGK